MRLLSVRLIGSLILGITLVSLGFSYYQVIGEKRGLSDELKRRADVLGESLAGNVEKLWDVGSGRELQRLVQRFGHREHLVGVAVYDRQEKLAAITPELGKALSTSPDALNQALAEDHNENSFVRLGGNRVHILALPLHHKEAVVGGLVVVHEASYIHAQVLRVWRETFVRPYDVDQTAEAIRAAVEMDPEDEHLRVHRMRRTIKDRNIYRWAVSLITELCEVRLDIAKDAHERRSIRASAA